MRVQAFKSSVAVIMVTALSFSVVACRHDTKPTPKTAQTQKKKHVTPAAGANTSYRTQSTAAANNVTMRALSLVGTPYLYGGNTPESGFDCSGLVNYVYRDVLNLKLPRTSKQLSQYQGPTIEPARLNTGDLVFFGSRGNVTHVGIYVGDGRFVHAPSTGGTVRLDSLAGVYWRDHYSGAKRILSR